MLPLDAIRECFEGVIPAGIATVDAHGVPNTAYLSQVQYVDAQHVALSYQFFNKTRQNLLCNPRARLQVTSPVTGAQYRLAVEFLRTETEGPLFENMKARLAGIASHTGMSNVFRLLGADVFRVHAVAQVDAPSLAAPPRRNLLAAVRQASQRLSACCDLERLFSETLACLREHFHIAHAMLMVADPPAQRLYTVASCGYGESGVGSEIAYGQGVIGVAARECTPIRIGHLSAEYAYSRAIRESALQSGMETALETGIPLPGLSQAHSQLAVPIVGAQRLLGVIHVESVEQLRFSYDDEDALVALANQIGAMMLLLQGATDEAEDAAPVTQVAAEGPPLAVRHFAGSDSIFLGEDYLIKGVAGSILWAVINDVVHEGRLAFSNRELRLDPRIRLPDIADNLEARLILLARRLDERSAPIRLEKTGRGRFRICVSRPLRLIESA
jgi:adenylate cyclase